MIRSSKQGRLLGATVGNVMFLVRTSRTFLNEQWGYIGVESWPSMEAVNEREKYENEELQISRYVGYNVHLGIEQSFEEHGQPQRT